MHPLAPEAARSFSAGRAARGGARRARRAGRVRRRRSRGRGDSAARLSAEPAAPRRNRQDDDARRVPRRGIGSGLIAEAERLAVERGKTLINLDTASEEGASAFYEKNGYVYAGEIPDYALKPMGGLTGTRLYWKRLAAPAAAPPASRSREKT